MTSLEQQVVIRKLQQADLPQLEWGGELAHFRNIFAAVYQQYLHGDAILWVAELPGAGVVAQVFIQLISHRPELANGNFRAYLFGFRVQSAYQNRGIGTRMLRKAEDDLRAMNFQLITLNVGRENADAIRLYERLGYRIVGNEPGQWSYINHLGKRVFVDEPSYRMEKRL